MEMDEYHLQYPYWAPGASSNARTHVNPDERTAMLARQADLTYGLPWYDETRLDAEPASDNEPSASPPRKRHRGKTAADLSDDDDDDNLVAPTNAEVRAGTALQSTRRRRKAADGGNVASEDAKIATENPTVIPTGYMLVYLDPGFRWANKPGRRRRGQRPWQAPPAPERGLPGMETVPMPSIGQFMDRPIPRWRLPSVDDEGRLYIPVFWRAVPEPIPGWLPSALVHA
jgi:hypothetical protein